MKLPARPMDLSYYTTWWLTPTSSTSSPNTTSNDIEENLLIETGAKKQVNTSKNIFQWKQIFFFIHSEND